MSTKRRRNIIGVQLHNALPHNTDCGTTSEIHPVTIPVEPYFHGQPIRAIDQKTYLGELNVTIGNAPVELPVYELSILGLRDEARVSAYIDHLRKTSPEHPHLILTSQIGHAALQQTTIETQFTETNSITFGVPADIERQLSTGVLQYAARIDQPDYQALEPCDTDTIDRVRRSIMQHRDLRLSNNMPTDTILSNVHVRHETIIEPHYTTELVGFTVEGTPITRPTLERVSGSAEAHANVHLLHPRTVHALRRLGETGLIARSFMTIPRRNTSGVQTSQVEALAVYSHETLDLIASHVS